MPFEWPPLVRRCIRLVVKLVYLDQNAASYLALQDRASRWGAIRALIEEGCHSGQLLCPMPLETLAESAPCTRAKREAIEQFFRTVSGGLCFKRHTDILIDETLALVRTDHPVVPFLVIGEGWGVRDGAAQQSASAMVTLREEMRQRIADYQHTAEADNRSADERFDSAAMGRSGMLWRDLDRFVACPSTPAADYEVGWLMTGLLKHGLTLEEAVDLMEAVRHRRWIAILVNFFDLKLGSRWDHDGECGQRPNYDPNDEIDRWRASVALAHSAMFITDSYIADLCRRAQVRSYSSTSVFSVRQVEEIAAWLNGVVNASR